MFVKSHYSLTRLLLALVLLSAVLSPIAPTAQAADGWSGTARITNNKIEIFPDIVIDSQGVSHVVYTETPDFNTSRIVRYINNRGGSWSSPITLSAGGLFADLGRLSTLTINGKVYLALVYKGKVGNNVNSRIYYRLSTDGGVTWSTQEQLTTVPSYEPAVALDPSGQPHVVFSYQPGSDLTLAYSTKVNGAWTSPVVVSPEGNAFNRDTTIGYTQSGGTLTLHVLFMGGINGNKASKRIYYTRKVGSGAWQPAQLRQSNNGGGFPKLVTDTRSSIYGIWHVDAGANWFEPYFSRSTDNGATWKTPQDVGSLTSVIGENPAIARTPGGKLVVMWEDQYNTTDTPTQKRDIYARTSNDNGTTWSGIQNVSPASGFSRNVAVAGGPSGFRAVWHDDRSGKYHVYTSAYSAASPGPTATLQLPARTKDNAVPASFFNISGTPTEIRWRWGAAPTDTEHDSTGTNGWVTFTTPLSIPLPTHSTPNSCEALTLYTQVKNGTLIQAGASSASVISDQTVEASVEVINPHLASIPATIASTGASDGDPHYTRDNRALLRIVDIDCSGLSTFSVTPHPPTPAPAFAYGVYVGTTAIPDKLIVDGKGTGRISVAINDALGNLGNFSGDITYDSADTSAGVGAGLPVVHSGSAAADNAASIIQTLTLSNLNVTDNVYGPAEGLSSNREFWGLWMATATSDVGADNISTWYPVRVDNPNADQVKVKWNVFTGLNFGLDPNKPGRYFVYIRFLDGAGNPSIASTALKAVVDLPAGYTFPSLELPVIRK